MGSIKLFILHSESENDKIFKEELCKHLSTLIEDEYISEVDTGEVLPGRNKIDDLKKRMGKSDIIAMLLSVDFFNTDETQLLESEAFTLKGKKDIVLVPIKIRSCNLPDTYAQFSMLPDQSKPVEDLSWGSRDEAYMNITEGIKKLAQTLQPEQPEQKVHKPSTPSPNPSPIKPPVNGGNKGSMSKQAKIIIGSVLGLIVLGIAIWQLLPGPDLDTEAFSKAKQTDSSASYKAYKRDFSEGKYITEAQNNIDRIAKDSIKLVEKVAWTKASSDNTLTSYNYYIQEYPKGDSINVAIKRRDALYNTNEDNQAWAEASKDPTTIDKYLNYIEKFKSKGLNHDNAVLGLEALLTKNGCVYYGETNTDGRMKSDRFFDQMEAEKDAKPKTGDLITSKKGVTVRRRCDKNSGTRGTIGMNKIASITEISSEGGHYWVKIKYE